MANSQGCYTLISHEAAPRTLAFHSLISIPHLTSLPRRQPISHTSHTAPYPPYSQHKPARVDLRLLDLSVKILFPHILSVQHKYVSGGGGLTKGLYFIVPACRRVIWAGCFPPHRANSPAIRMWPAAPRPTTFVFRGSPLRPKPQLPLLLLLLLLTCA